MSNTETATVKPEEPPNRPDDSSRQWQVKLIGRLEGGDAMRWDALNRKVFGAHPFLTSSFVDQLLAHFGSGAEHLCSYTTGGEDVAMCILVRRSTFLWTTFLPSQAQMGPLLVTGTASTSGLLASLPGLALAADLMCIDPEVAGTIAPPSLRLRIHHGLTMSVKLIGTFDEYWSGRPSQLRKNLRRYVNRANDHGLQQRHVVIDQPNDITSAVRRYAELESAGWKGKAGTALSSGSQQLVFYEQLLTHAAAEGEAAVHELWLGDQLAASRLLLLGGDRIIILKTTYREDMASYAPGRQLLRLVLAHAFANYPGQTVEFYTNATRDQLEWATHWRQIRHVRRYRNELSGLALRVLRMARISLRPPVLETSDTTQVEIIREPNALPKDVVALLESDCRSRGIQQGLDWLTLLTEHVLSRDHEVEVYVLRQNSAAVAVIAIASPYQQPRAVRSLSSFYTALYSPVLAPWLDATDLVPLVQAIRRNRPRATRFDFEPMDIDSREFVLWRAALEAGGLVPTRYFRFGNWYLPCAQLRADGYFQARSGSMRSTLKRAKKRFALQGGSLEIISSAERIEPGIAAYQAVYAASWKTREPFPEFISAVMRRSAERGWLRLGIAWLGEKPIAAQLWIVSHGRAEIFKLAYDEAHRSLSAGTLLTAELMKHALDKDRVDEVDYLTGDDTYKRDWMSHRRERWGIVAYDPLSLSGLAGLVWNLFGRLIWVLRGRPGRGQGQGAPGTSRQGESAAA